MRGALIVAALGAPACAIVAGIGDQFELAGDAGADGTASSDGRGPDGGGGGPDGTVDLDAAPPSYADAVLLAQSSLGTLSDMALDENGVYWVTQGGKSASRVHRDGAVEPYPFPTSFSYRSIALDPTQVFISEADIGCADAGILAVMLKSGSTDVKQAKSCAIRRLVTHGDWAYGLAELPDAAPADPDSGADLTLMLRRFRTYNIAQSEDLMTAVLAPRALAVDDVAVYVATPDAILRRAIATGEVTTLVPGENVPYELALDGPYLYWVSSASNAVRRVALDGTKQPETVAANQNGPDHLTVFGGMVVWSNITDSTLMTAPADGRGAPRRLASDTGHVVRIAADPLGLYWATSDGAVYWMARQ